MLPADDEGQGIESEQDWLRRIIEEMLPTAWTTASEICWRRQDAEDALQSGVERFVKACRSGSIDRGGNPWGYLLKAVRNQAIEIRRRNADPLVSPQPVSHPEEHVERMVEHQAFAVAFTSLNPRHQEALRVVVEMEGDMSLAGAAMRPPLTGKAMRGLAFRARRALRRNIVEAMVGGWPSPECENVVGSLIAGRSLSAEEQMHLSDCSACAYAEEELASQGVHRMAFLPVAAVVLDRALQVVDREGIGLATGTGTSSGVSAGPGVVVAGGVALVVAAAATLGVGASWWGSGDAGDGADAAVGRPPSPAIGDPPQSGEYAASDPVGDGRSVPSESAPSSDTPLGGEGTESPPVAVSSGEPTPRSVTPIASAPTQPDGTQSSAPVVELDSLVSIIVGSGNAPVEITIPPLVNPPLPPILEIELISEGSVVDVVVLGQKVVGEP